MGRPKVHRLAALLEVNIVSSCSNIRKLEALSKDLLDAAFKEIRSYREKNSPSNTERFGQLSISCRKQWSTLMGLGS